MVNIIVQSSIPNVPPQHLSRATMRRIKAIKAITPPATPAYDTTLVRSRMGAPHAAVVTFFVAWNASVQLRYWLTAILFITYLMTVESYSWTSHILPKQKCILHLYKDTLDPWAHRNFGRLRMPYTWASKQLVSSVFFHTNIWVDWALQRMEVKQPAN